MKSKVVPVVFINGKELKNILSPITINDRYVSLKVVNPKTLCTDSLSFSFEEVEIVMRSKEEKQ